MRLFLEQHIDDFAWSREPFVEQVIDLGAILSPLLDPRSSCDRRQRADRSSLRRWLRHRGRVFWS
jgi:hypothetical protein